MRWWIRVAVLLVMSLLVGTSAGDVVTLNNGTTVEGTVFKFGNEYRIKLADGSTRIIPERDVRSISRGASPAPGTVAEPGERPRNAASAGFQSTKLRADAVAAPILAVTIWEQFIEGNPTEQDLAAAKSELDKWQQLANDNAEKINGKWIGGEERRKLLQEVNSLCAEARDMMESQTLQALEKYQKAIALYPSCFEANFAMGYYHLRKGAVGSTGRGNNAEIERAVRALETSVRLRPESPEALSNLAIGYAFKQRWEDSVVNAHKAVKIEDSKPLVENLINLLVIAPNGMKTNNRKVAPIIEEAALLAQKYGIGPRGTGQFHYLPPKPPGMDKSAPADATDEGRPGVIGNGSGFLVSADGYLITNRHVAEGRNRLFRVRFDDGTEKSAEVVAIDNEYDIALLKVKADKPLDFLRIAPADLPNPGSRCMVLGYPVGFLLDYQMQVTSGEINSAHAGDEYQVTLTANTTHGNSGGPIVDRDCNVIGVLSAGLEVFNATYVKALSAGQIRGFLHRVRDKHESTFAPGEITDTPFDGEQLALKARKATLLILIIRGDGPAGD